MSPSPMTPTRSAALRPVVLVLRHVANLPIAAVAASGGP